MHLQALHLINFKNYEDVRLEFSSKINVLVGKNGSGKTNLLDAIHFLSLTRSAFCSDTHTIRQEQPFMTVKGVFKQHSNINEIFCSLQPGSKKIVREGINEYSKMSDHVGKYPVVLIAPDDTALVKEGSEERRKFFDALISQIDHSYLEALIQYTFALKQRNSLLKMFADQNTFDSIALESYDELLIRNGSMIAKTRSLFIDEFLPVFQSYYSFIVANEEVNLAYKTEVLKMDFAQGLKANRQRDQFTQRTNFGIHKDDFVFTLRNGELKRFGSQGQQKSFVIALKLAQWKVIQNHKGYKPILLMDDIFDKLDDHRIEKLLELIQKDELGQLFITDARPDRTSALLESVSKDTSFYHVSDGIIVQ